MKAARKRKPAKQHDNDDELDVSDWSQDEMVTAKKLKTKSVYEHLARISRLHPDSYPLKLSKLEATLKENRPKDILQVGIDESARLELDSFRQSTGLSLHRRRWTPVELQRYKENLSKVRENFGRDLVESFSSGRRKDWLELAGSDRFQLLLDQLSDGIFRCQASICRKLIGRAKVGRKNKFN